ncbi:hypothetical protein TNCV_3987831 [Trichonephila clavipes]|nr:hypothetical protein TNCV_3987831 [Trichonephila clavipes]
MSRSGGQTEAKPPMFSPQASLCPVRSVAIVAEITRLSLSSGMKYLLTGGKFTSAYCISIGKGKTTGKLWGMSGLLGKVISVLDLWVGNTLGLLCLAIISCVSSESPLRIACSTDLESENSRKPLELSITLLWKLFKAPFMTISCQVVYSQFGLAIHQNDHQARRRFVEWAQNEIAVVPDFHKRILFSDEVHFWLNGYVNKQNCRIWSEANPQVYVETPLHPEKLTVWCALWAGGILLQKP